MNLRDPQANPDCRRCGGVGRVKIGPGVHEVALCPCVIATRRMEAAEMRIERLFPGRAKQMTLRAFETGGLARNERALRVARNFVEHYRQACEEGWMLGFWGPPAAGKTHLAVGVAQACIKRYGAHAELVNFPRMLFDVRERWTKMKGETGTSPLTKAMDAQLLILDDFGAHYDANVDRSQVTWVMEQLYLVLDERIMMNRPTVYTMNLQPSTLEAQLNNEAGERVLSRIQRAEVGRPLEVAPVRGLNRQSEDAARKLFS
jgi:DNA replication protein DnaC